MFLRFLVRCLLQKGVFTVFQISPSKAQKLQLKISLFCLNCGQAGHRTVRLGLFDL